MRLPTLFLSALPLMWLGAQLMAEEIPKHLPAAAEGKAWQLVWHDEFTGTELDESKWDVPPDGKRRDAYWKREAISVDGQGHLLIRTLHENDQYIDGCVRTKDKFETTFGYFEARLQLQSQPGHWSAFWLMGDGVNKVGEHGRDGTEVDIMEKPWLDNRVQHTLHWDGYGEQHRSEGKVVEVPGVMDGFHTFGLLWSPDEYVFFVDGRETWRTSAGGVCQSPLFIKLSDEVGSWGGNIGQAKLPDQFLVDYVRVFQLVEAPDASAATCEWHRAGDSLSLRWRGRTLWQFNFASDLDVPFFHPLSTTTGQILSLDAPPDHVWHHGLWFCWKFINGVNYWELNPQTRRPDGITRWSEPGLQLHDDGSAVIDLNLRYQPANGEVVLTEQRAIAISSPDIQGVYHLDWTSAFTAGDQPVVLDRTPPREQSWGGYAGLSLRFSPAFSQRQATSTQGIAAFGDGGRHRSDAAAMDYSGWVDGHAAGVTVLDHPQNPRHPTSWYLINRGEMGYLNASILAPQPLQLQANQRMVLRYRVIVHPEAWDAARLQQAIRQFTSDFSRTSQPSLAPNP